jgi:TolB protein
MRIAFYSSRQGPDNIYGMNADGSNILRLTDSSEGDFSPAWSPDGARIVFTSKRDGNYEIYIMDPDGSNLFRLTNNDAMDYAPSWMP